MTSSSIYTVSFLLNYEWIIANNAMTKNNMKFIVAEPLLGAIDLEIPLNELDDRPLWIEFIDWIVVGGESGPRFRPLDMGAVQKLQQQCERWDKAFFFKQVGGLRPSSNGDQLDGVHYHQIPRTNGI